MNASGSNLRLTFIEEVTWGTTPATPQMTVLAGVTAESLGGQQEAIVSQAINPNRGVSYMAAGQKKSAGDIQYELGVVGAVSLLSRLLGNVSTTGTGPYTHEITVGTGPKSLTIEKWFNDVDLGFVFRGCKPNNFSLSVDPNGIATGSIGMLAKSYESTTVELDATPTDKNHAFYDGIRASIKVDGVAADFLTLTLNGTNNLQDARAIGKDVSTGITPEIFAIDGSFTVQYENNDIINKAIAGTEDSLEITFTNGTNSVEFLLPRIKYSGDVLPKAGGNGPVNLEINFTALVDITAGPTLGKSIVITVVNDDATL